MIEIENAVPAIVDRSVWEKVQENCLQLLLQ